MWIDSSINSTDGRNGRNFINIRRKKRFLEVYGSISNSKVVVVEQTNKHGRKLFSKQNGVHHYSESLAGEIK